MGAFEVFCACHTEHVRKLVHVARFQLLPNVSHPLVARKPLNSARVDRSRLRLGIELDCLLPHRVGSIAAKRKSGRPHDTARIGDTLPCAGPAQNSAQASISLRRFSNRSVRLYAASVLSLTACASAISHTSEGNAVCSAAQSRND